MIQDYEKNDGYQYNPIQSSSKLTDDEILEFAKRARLEKTWRNKKSVCKISKKLKK